MSLSRRFKKLPDPVGVDAGQTAVWNLPPSGTYYSLQLRYKQGAAGGPTQAQVESDLTECRLKIGGKVQRVFSLRQLIDIYNFYGNAMDFGAAAAEFAYIDIHFSEPWRPTVPGEDGLAWGMAGVDTFTLEVDIAAGANAPALELYAVRSVVTTRIGLINQWRRFTLNPSAAGEHDFTPPKRGSLYGIHMDMAAVTINSCRIEADDDTLFEGSKERVDKMYKTHGFVPQSDWFHATPDKITGRTSESMVFFKEGASGREPITDFRFIVDTAGAGAIPTIAEYLENPA